MAPPTVSSAGWPTITSVPCHLSFACASSVAAPTHEVMCTSWPQACITGTVSPASFFVVTLLAKGRPVFSGTGSASRSVRSITVGPGPFFRTPTTPVLPTPVVTSKPARRSRSAILAAVFSSWKESSGDWCRSR